MLAVDFASFAPMTPYTITCPAAQKGWRLIALTLLLCSLAWVGLSSSAAQAKTRRIVSMQLADLQEGARVTVVADLALGDYEAFRKGDRFYVKFPASEFASALPRLRGRGFEDVQVQKSSDSVVISFKLQPGSSARVDQRFNRLDIVFSAVRLANSNVANQDVLSALSQNRDRRAVNPSPNSLPQQQRGNAKPSTSADEAVAFDNRKNAESSEVAQTKSDPSSSLQNSSASPSPTSTQRVIPLSMENGPRAVSIPTGTPYRQIPAGSTWNERKRTLLQWWKLNKPVAIGILVFLGIVLLYLLGRLLLRLRAARKPKPPKRWEGERVGPRQVSVVPTATRTPALPAPSAQTEPLQTQQLLPPPDSSPEVKPDAPVVLNALTDTELDLEVPEGPVVTPVSSPLPEVNEVTVDPRSKTPPPSERTELELQKLLSGNTFDVNIIDAADIASRQMIASSLLAVLAGYNFDEHDYAREAFLDYGYFDETTRELRAAESPASRVAAARKLGLVADTRGTAHLIGALYDSSPEVRRAAVESLGQLGDPVALPALNELLQREISHQLPEAVIRDAINSVTVTEVKRNDVPEKAPLRVVESNKTEVLESSTQELSETIDLLENEEPVEIAQLPAPAPNVTPSMESLMSEAEFDEEELKLHKEEEALRRAAEELERRRVESEAARLQAEQEARLQAEREAKERAEIESRVRLQQESERVAAQDVLRKKAEEEERVKAEAARLKGVEAARMKAEEDARFRVEAETLRRAAEDLARKRAESSLIREIAEEEANRKREAERHRLAEEESRRAAEAEANRKAKEEIQRQVEAELQRRVEEELRRRTQHEAEKQVIEQRLHEEAEKRRLFDATRREMAEVERRKEEEARKAAEEQAIRLAEEDAAVRQALSEESLEDPLDLGSPDEDQFQREQAALLKAADAIAMRRREISEAHRTADEEARLLLAAQERIRAEEESRRQVADERQRLEEEALRRAQEERRRFEDARRRTLEEQQQLELEARHRAEEEERLLVEARQRIKLEEEARLRTEAERNRLLLEAQRRTAEEQRQFEESRQRAIEEQLRLEEDAHQRASEEARLLLETQERIKREEAARRAAAEERLRLEAEASRRAEEERSRIERVIAEAAEEKRRIEEDLLQQAEEEERRLAELENARKQAEEQARRRAEIEKRIRAEIDALRKAEIEQKQRIEAETLRRSQAEARLREEKARRQQEEEARIKAEREAHLAEEARSTLDATARRRIEEETRIRAEREARLQAEEEALRREQELNRIRADREARLRSNEEAHSRDEEEYRQRIDEENRLRAEREAEARATDDAQRQLEQENRRPLEPENETPTQEASEISEPKGSPPFELSVDSNVPLELFNRLSDPGEQSRAAAVSELARLGGDDAFRLISRAFDDDSLDVRNASARALYEMHSDRAASFTRVLREATPETRRRIGGALATSGLANDAIANLTGESRDRTYDAFSLLFLMAKTGEVEPLMKAIEDYPSNEVRLAVVKLLALGGQPEILPTFRRLAVQGSLPADVRAAVMEAVYQISSQNRETETSAA